jgi:hypothetical protein
MWGSDSNIIFSNAFFLSNAFWVTGLQTDSRSTQKYNSEPHNKKFNGRGYFLGNS